MNKSEIFRRTYTALSVIGLLWITSCAANVHANEVDQTNLGSIPVEHPTPSDAEVDWPSDVVMLFDEPNQTIEHRGVEIYQNGSKDFSNDPFKLYVSPSAFSEYVDYMKDQGYISDENVRFVYHYPGDPSGSELLCENGSANIILLEAGRAIYEHVYLNHFLNSDLSNQTISSHFLLEAQNQINFVFWHEGKHIQHCRDGVESRFAEEDSIKSESAMSLIMQPVLYLRLKDGTSLDAAMKYVESLR